MLEDTKGSSSLTCFTGAHLAARQTGDQGVQQMRPLPVAQLGMPFRGCGEQFSLIHTTELHINIQILFVQHLENRVEQTAQRRVRGLFDDLGGRLARIVLRHQSRQPEHIHAVFRRGLVRAAEDKPKLFGGNPHCLQHGSNDELVVFRSMFDDFDRALFDS